MTEYMIYSGERTFEQMSAELDRLEELKHEYAVRMGWDEEEYWWEDDDKLYAAECYAYGILEKEGATA